MWQLVAIPLGVAAYYLLIKPPVPKKPIDLGQPAPRSNTPPVGPVVNVPVVQVVIPATPHTATIPVPPATVPATVDPVTKVVTIPPTVITGTATILNPGPEPVFSITPAAGLVDTATHRAGQANLLRWAEKVGFQVPGDSAQYLPELGGVAYNAQDVNGVTDRRNRSTIWLFQRYYNFVMQPGGFQGTGSNLVFVPAPITEDGLFGTQTYSALKQVQA